MLADVPIPAFAVAYWVLVTVIFTAGAAFLWLELRGVHAERGGDTFSETWWWLRDNRPALFKALMVLLIGLLLIMAGLVFMGFYWLIPHFETGGH